MVTKVLILSHTNSISNFKIGSHHYANFIKKKRQNFEVFFCSLPNSLLHKIRGERKEGKIMIEKEVEIIKIDSFLPITIKLPSVIEKFNSELIFRYEVNNKIFNINFDIVICDYPYFVKILNKIRYRKLIYRPTDDYVAMRGKSAEVSEKKILAKCDMIICTSEIVKKSIIDRYNETKEIFVIENGFDSSHFSANVSSKRGGCVYVGALDKRFDFEVLLEVAKKLPKVKFDIYGPLDNKLNHIFENSPDNLKFKGVAEYSELPEILNKYKIGLLPLKGDNGNNGRSPMKLWEYTACGLKVVYSNIEHLKDNKDLYKYSNAEDLKSLIERIDFNYRLNNENNDYLIDKSWDFKTDILLKKIKILINE